MKINFQTHGFGVSLAKRAFRWLNAIDFAEQNQPKFPKKGRLSKRKPWS